MITCPVCDHKQAKGDECEACGKQLAVAAPVEVKVVPMADLEGTTLAGGKDKVEVQEIADLEATKLKGGPDLPPVVVPDIDRTELEKVGEVKLDMVEGIDRAREQDDGPRTQLTVGSVTCRYCKNVQTSGSICTKCGMRLPKFAKGPEAAAPAAVTGLMKRKDPPKTRCKGCGAPALGGMKCGDCGRDVPMPDA